MQLFLAFIKDEKSILFEIDDELFFNDVGNFVEKASEIFVIVVICKYEP